MKAGMLPMSEAAASLGEPMRTGAVSVKSAGANGAHRDIRLVLVTVGWEDGILMVDRRASCYGCSL